MCGINGFVSVSPSVDDDIALVERMNQAIIHRGGDFAAVHAISDGALGHCRLSIQDLSSAAHQPFVKDDYVLVFNGEIYNFKALADTLDGVSWKSGSDTEVLLEMWRRYGPSCLSQLRGMFAFALYQLSSQELYLCRDFFGIKPLYYHHNDGQLWFSSELKAISQVVESLSINPGVIAESLLLCWIRDSQCVFNDIQKLQPGQLLTWRAGQVELKTYWQPASLLQSQPIHRSIKSSVETLDNVLQQSVKAHMVADVPVSAFLSGGLDSSLLVAMARQHAAQLSCYTIRFSDADQRFEKMADDHFYAQKVAKDFGLPLHTIEVKPDLAKLLQQVVHHLDEPIGDSAAINTFLICQAAHQAGVKVLLSGMGADEIFGGYRKHAACMYAADYRRLPSVIRRGIGAVVDTLPAASAEQGFRLTRWAKKFLSFANLPEDEAFLRSYSYYSPSELSEICLFDCEQHVSDLQQEHADTYHHARQLRGSIDAMCFTDVTHFMVGLNLHYTDRASMAFSTEVRVPFIDREVVECGFSIAESLKIKSGQQKYLLKKVAERWLPHDIIYRPKSPFTLPLRAWIKHDLRGMVADYLLADDGLAGRGLIRPSFLTRLVNEEQSGQQDHAQKIWHLLTLEQWLRNQSARSASF